MSLELKWILLCLVLVTGEVLGFAVDSFSFAWPVAAGAALIVALIGYGLAIRNWHFAFALVAGIALALLTAQTRRERLDEMRTLNRGRPVKAEFAVGGDLTVGKDSEGKQRATFAGSIQGIPVRVVMSLDDAGMRPHVGETWELCGWLARGEDKLFGGRRRTFWVRGRGAAARKIADEPSDALTRVRQSLSRRVGIGLGWSREAADLNRAMLLGERFRIPNATRQKFVDAGTVHVFAISGLHVLFIAKIFAVLLAFTFIPSRWAGLVLIPLLWGYVILVGSCPSAVRAATMASVYYLAPVFWRTPNAFVAWSIAFLITYIYSPEMVFDVGCTLSFVVMFAIITWIWWSKELKAGWIRSLGVPAAAWLAGVPIAAHVFGRITPGGLIANLFAVSFAQVSVTAGALGLMTSFVWDRIAAHFNNLAALSTTMLVEFSGLVAAQGWSSQSVRPWSLAECIAWYAVAGVVMAVLHPRRLKSNLFP